MRRMPEKKAGRADRSGEADWLSRGLAGWGVVEPGGVADHACLERG